MDVNHVVCKNVYEIIITLLINTMNISQSYYLKKSWLWNVATFYFNLTWYISCSLYHALAQFFSFQLGQVWWNLNVNLSIIKNGYITCPLCIWSHAFNGGPNVDRLELSFGVYLVNKDPKMGGISWFGSKAPMIKVLASLSCIVQLANKIILDDLHYRSPWCHVWPCWRIYSRRGFFWKVDVASYVYI